METHKLVPADCTPLPQKEVPRTQAAFFKIGFRMLSQKRNNNHYPEKEKKMEKTSREDRLAKVIEVLNKARGMELHAISQYMNQHYNLDDMDFGDLAKNIKLIAIDEMRHAEMLAERIKELGGEPTAEPIQKAVRAQKVEDIFPFDANLEDVTMDEYNQFLMVCRENGDSTSVKIFETLIDEEQEHFNYFDNIGGHIEKLGQVFLAQKAGTPSSTGPPSKGFITGAGGE
jgi:bacterioferritin